MGVMLSLKYIHSAAHSIFAPNVLIMPLSITIASGPRCGNTKASTGKNLLPSLSAKRIYPNILRGVPSALRNDIAPGGMGNTQLYRNFEWLRMKESLRYTGYVRCGVNSEFMLFVVSSQGSSYADSS